ncbi:hypothetical protein ACVWY5_002342 [Bradyrhizobium sp. USDA 3256]
MGGVTSSSLWKTDAGCSRRRAPALKRRECQPLVTQNGIHLRVADWRNLHKTRFE